MRNSAWSFAAAAALITLLSPASILLADVPFYVAPDGNDAWSGTLAAPNAGKTDGPFATPARALRAVRVVNAQVPANEPRRAVTVYVRGGRYELAAPVVLTPEDSGTAGAPVTLAAYKDESPVLSGGVRVTKWTKGTVGGRDVWTAKLPPKARPTVRSLWVNGKRRTRARHPNAGYLRVAAVPGKRPGDDWTKGVSGFAFHAGDLKAWPTAADAEVVVMSRWVESRLPVGVVNEPAKLFDSLKKTVFELEPNDLYYAEGAADFIDAPGEWCVDRKAKVLHYLPRPGETPDAVEAVVPVLGQIVRMDGEPDAGKYVEHVAFRGVTFAHAEFDLFGPNEDGPAGFPQAAIGVPGAVYGSGVRDCTFDRCTFAHLGTYALELARGAQRNVVSRCTLTDLGAGGVKLGEQAIRDDEREQSFGNQVADCRITDAGLTFHSGVGVWVGQAYDNRVEHNEIADLYYTAISVGWTWGYGRSLARGNVIEANHVRHVGKRSDGDGPILSDMGALYTLGNQPGTVIRGNLFHDIDGVRYGGWGIYFDEGSTGVVAERNLVYRTAHGGFHQHYGRDNVVRNNVFAFGREHQVARSRPEEHQSFRFERNIVYWDRGQGVVGNWGNFNVAFDSNIYWCFGGGKATFAGLAWEDWRKKGMDDSSITADPMFVDPGTGDFRLRRESPSGRIGFLPLELSDVGPRG